MLVAGEGPCEKESAEEHSNLNGQPVLRPATAADAAALVEIYRPYVERTAASFELVAPTVEQFAGRIRKSLDGWAWLVAEVDGQCAGYAYGTAHRERAAYRHTVETSAYVDERFHRRGLARALYTELLSRLRDRGFHCAVAGITLPNTASVALHEGLGFERIGVYKEVGFKFGVWHDSVWLQRGLDEAAVATPRTPTARQEVAAGTLHHVELYVSSLEASRRFWEPLLRALGYDLYQSWTQGFSFRLGQTYLVFVQAESPHCEAGYHRRRVGLNHLAFHAASRVQVDGLTAWVRQAGYRVLYEDRHPHAGGLQHYALYCEDPDGAKVEIVATGEAGATD